MKLFLDEEEKSQQKQKDMFFMPNVFKSTPEALKALAERISLCLYIFILMIGFQKWD